MRRYAIRKKDLDRYLDLPDEQISGLSDDEVADLIDEVLGDLFRMEEAVKRRKEAFDRLRKHPLMQRKLAELDDAVLEGREVVMRAVEQTGSIDWRKLVTSLVKHQPDLKAVVNEMEESHRRPNVTKILKHPKSKEPKKWKSVEHKPLRGARLAQGMESADEMAELRLIDRAIKTVNSLVADVSAAMRRQPQRMVADTYLEDVGLQDRQTEIAALDELNDDLFTLTLRYRSGLIDQNRYMRELSALESRLSDLL